MSARLLFTIAGLLLFGATVGHSQEKPDVPPATTEAPLANRLLKDNRPLADVGQPALTFGAIADKILPSVVTIRALVAQPGARALSGEAPVPCGSGFIISTTGHIVTANRPLEGASTIEVVMTVAGALRVVPARLVGADPATDIALLKVEDEGLPQAVLGDSNQVRAGDAAFAAGAAVVPHRSLVQGTVAGLGQGGRVIDTDIPIARLDAGGPLVDGLGRVIGIATASPPTQTGAPAGTALPINLALSILEPLMNEGTAKRAFLGIQIEDRTPAGTIPLTPEEPRQVSVVLIGSGSPAAEAGIEVGDVVTAVDGQAIPDSSRMRQLLGTRRPGDDLTIDILRGGQPLKVRARLTEVPIETAGAGTAPGSAPSPANRSGEMLPGLTIANLTLELRQQHAVPQDMVGVLVTEVAPDSRAAAMDVKPGDIITQVNRKPVSQIEEARDLAIKGEKTVLIKVNRRGDTMLFMVGR